MDSESTVYLVIVIALSIAVLITVKRQIRRFFSAFSEAYRGAEHEREGNKNSSVSSMKHSQTLLSSPRTHELVTKPSTIFISYRRTDSADVVGRIYDRLLSSYSKEKIFKDVDSIPLGVDFR
jgi:hypothetical protein